MNELDCLIKDGLRRRLELLFCFWMEESPSEFKTIILRMRKFKEISTAPEQRLYHGVNKNNISSKLSQCMKIMDIYLFLLFTTDKGTR